MAEELEGNFFSSYNLTVQTPIDIDQMIYQLAPEDLPLTAGIGANGLPTMTRNATGDREFNWMEERAPLPHGTVAEALDSSETAWTMTAGDAVKYAIGDAIKVDSEIVLVTDIDTSTEVITVVRAYAGTSADSHADGSVVKGLGSLLPEGDVGSANYVGRDLYTNYTQIWSKTIRATGTEQVIRKYGIPNEVAHQMVIQHNHLATSMEQAALYAVKYQDSATRKRSSGGLASWITTNVDSTTDWLTVGNIEQMQQAAYDLGGHFTHLMARVNAFGALNNLDGSERITTVTIDDRRRGRQSALQVITEFGVLNLVRNRWCHTSDAFGYKPEQFSMRTLRPMQVQKLAKTDDTDTWLMVCEAGWMLKGQAHCAKWTGLDPSAAMPSVLI